MEPFNINSLLTKDKKTIKERTKQGAPVKLNKQDKRVVAYLTENEMNEFKTLAENETLNISTYLRKVIVEHLKSGK